MRFWRFLKISAIILLVTMPACMVQIEGSRQGQVIDAETGEPLANVAVVNEFDYWCMLPPNPGGANDHALGHRETFTDEEGRYSFSWNFYIKPPLLCSVKESMSYLRPDYYNWSYHLAAPWHLPPPDNEVTARLKRRTHLLSYQDYQSPGYRVSSIIRDEDKPLMERRHAAATSALSLVANDDPGVFIRHPGRTFDMVSRVEGGSSGYLLFVHDAIEDKWLLLDDRGVEFPDKMPKLPKWEFTAGYSTSSGGLFASQNKVMYQEARHRHQTDRPSFTVEPAKGQISAIVGHGNHFFTLEAQGRYLCRYGKFEKVVQFREAYDARELADTANDDASFTFITSRDSNTFVALRQSDGTKILRFARYKHDEPPFELARLPASLEILDMETLHGRLFFAIRNEGIRVYNHDMQEEKKQPFTDFNKLIDAEITDIALGAYRTLYIAIGEDRILRASLQGIADYPVELASGALAEDWYISTDLPKKAAVKKTQKPVMVRPAVSKPARVQTAPTPP